MPPRTTAVLRWRRQRGSGHRRAHGWTSRTTRAGSPSIGTFFIILGWIAVIYAVIAGILWWIDLAQRAAFNIFEAFAISAAAIGVPIFAAFVLAGFGYFLRLFALWVASQSR